MTAEQDRGDLARHEPEVEAHEPFDDALLDELVPRWLAEAWPFARWRIGV